METAGLSSWERVIKAAVHACSVEIGVRVSLMRGYKDCVWGRGVDDVLPILPSLALLRTVGHSSL